MKKHLFDFGLLSVGAASFAFGFAVFLKPLAISPGGITGVAYVLSKILSLPTGALVFFLNLPLVYLGWKKLGKSLIIKTFFVILLSSLLIDAFSFLKPLTDDRIIASLSGGVLIGAGMALIFLRGGTSGGTDIAAKLIRRKNPYVQMGRIILIIDAIIIGAAALLDSNFSLALYSVLYVIVSTYIIDKALSDEGGKLAIIITTRPEKLKREIYENLGRGVSEISALGGFSGENKTLILCALYKRQSGDFRKIVKQFDPEAFSIILEASEVLGIGFKE